MVGKIPGLITLSANPPVPSSAFSSKGFDMGIVAVLESPEHLVSYATHPAHLAFVYYNRFFASVANQNPQSPQNERGIM